MVFLWRIFDGFLQTAREGRYDEALALLLHPDIWQGLTIHDYSSWSHQIWYILVLRTTRRGQFRLYREFLLPMRPIGFNPKHFFFNAEHDRLPPNSESLYQLLRLRVRLLLTLVIYSDPLINKLGVRSSNVRGRPSTQGSLAVRVFVQIRPL